MDKFNRDNMLLGAQYGLNTCSIIGVLGTAFYIARKTYSGEPLIEGNKRPNSFTSILWNMANTVSKVSRISAVVFLQLVSVGVFACYGKGKLAAIVLVRADTALLGVKTLHNIYTRLFH